MREAILSTIVYFDLFDYPLTLLEVWKFLYRPGREVGLEETENALFELAAGGKIETRAGFWFLSGRGEILHIRARRAISAERKFKKAKKAAGFLRMIPWVRMVAVSNTLALSHAQDESDIDFFVVTESGALWKSRFFGVLPFAFFGMRPEEGWTRDKFCFCMFAAMDGLELQRIAISPEDPYLAYWIASLVPVYDPDGVLEAVFESNEWLYDILPNARATLPSRRRRQGSFFPARDSLETKPGIVESICRAAQFARFPHGIRTAMNQGDEVIVTDSLLKLHGGHERRLEIRSAFYARLAELGASNL